MMDPLTMPEVLERVKTALRERARLNISVVNVAKLVNMRKDEMLCRSVTSGDLVLADGMPLVWLSRLRGPALPERVTGIDLMYRLFELADREGLRVFLLGATQDVLDEVIAVARRRYPGACIAGARNGYFTERQDEEVARQVREARADVLLVAMSSPKKELFMRRWEAFMNVHVCHGVGGSFDVMAGKVRRAPMWMQRCGLEWLYRVVQEPRRLWRRYLVTNLSFARLALVWLIRGNRSCPGYP
jgi:N-acetylglucosaminyldiphosphoundecaprenol N-acetyl-beta-D-mannosaminyltransferase